MNKRNRYGGRPPASGFTGAARRLSDAPTYEYDPVRAQWLPAEQHATPALPVAAPPAPSYRPPRLPRSTVAQRLEEMHPLFRPFITPRSEDR